MSEEIDEREPDPLYDPDQPQLDRRHQFQLMHLLWAITGVAFFCAVAAPLIRAIEPGQHFMFLGLFVMQLLVTGAMVGYNSVRRLQVIRFAGKRFGVGYPGTIPGRHGPKILASVTLLVIALVQLVIAVLVTISLQEGAPPVAFVFFFQLAIFFGSSITQLMWGRSPGATEFFEKAIVRGGVHMIQWYDVTVRPSRYEEDRVVVIVRGNEAMGTRTFSLQVTPPLRDYLLERFPEGESPKLNQISTAIGVSRES